MHQPKQFFTLLFISSTLFYIGCKKVDHSTELKETRIQKFYNINSTTNIAIKGLNNSLKRKEELQSFTSEFINFAGYPIWDKSIVVSSSTSNNRSISGEELLLVPFAKESENIIGAIMAARINRGDTSIRMFYHWEYKNFPKMRDSSDRTFSAERVSLIFMAFNKYVFPTELL